MTETIHSLTGKTVFITGASRGIGRAIALRLAREKANIIITGKTVDPHPTLPGTVYSVAEEVKALGAKSLAIPLDVRQAEDIQLAITQAANHFGGIDVLVNNASAISLTPTLETPAKRFDLMLQVNARATFLCCQSAIPFLTKAVNPHILNLAPPINLDPKWFKNHLAYTFSKYGMSFCTLGMAEEFRGQGIAVNALWPRTTIATKAIEVHFPREILHASRKPEIVAEAAYYILTGDSRKITGNFFIDEDVLKAQGQHNFEVYALNPGTDLFTDLFIDS